MAALPRPQHPEPSSRPSGAQGSIAPPPQPAPPGRTQHGSDGHSLVLAAPVATLPSSAPLGPLEGSGASSQAHLPGPALMGGPASAEGQSLSVAPTPRDIKGHLEESQAGELPAYLQENLEAMQLASELARQKTHGALELVRAAGRGQVSSWIPLRRYPHPAQPPTAPREEPGLRGVHG